MPVAPPALRICTEHQPDAYVISVEGELDLSGCPALEVALHEAEQSDPRRIILDIEDLTFIDSLGLGVLLTACRRSSVNGNRLQLTRGKGQVADLFRLTALDATLPLADPALCPAIRGTRRVHAPDNSKRPGVGETVIARPTVW
jgi:anti-sigma B factor antagonist